MVDKKNDLPVEEVKRLVYSYQDGGVTDELYAFGSLLLTDIRNRAGRIDSKSISIMGWSTGILVFLFTQIDKRPGELTVLWMGFASGLCCLCAAAFSFLALRARNDWKWPSDRDWFEESALSSSDELKRFHVRSIHEVKQAQRQLADHKGSRLLVSQDFLMLGAVFLALGIATKVLS